MKDKFFINNDLVLINYTKLFPQNEISVLNSKYFLNILQEFYKYLKNNNLYLFKQFDVYNSKNKTVKKYQEFLIEVFVKDINYINSIFLKKIETSSHIFELLYDFYRSKLRLGIYYSVKDAVIRSNFIDVDTKFNDIVLSLYRTIGQKLQEHNNLVYRQLNAGTNGCLQVSKVKWNTKHIDFFKNINFITSLMLRTPLFLKTKSNKRTGKFKETQDNLLELFKNNENSNDWICYPCFVGNNLAFIYFHKEFIIDGIGLANLFELAKVDDYEDRKPNLIVFYGVQDSNHDGNFYYDLENDIYIGQVSNKPNNDYFGYIKKMTLTLHNLSNIKQKKLPVHGSMVNIILKNGKQKNVVFVGDSGTGKSETIEMLTYVGKKYIQSINVIFDDMGSFEVVGNNIKASGTEIGAFLRLDDLEKESIYKDIDRNIFFNAEQSLNARLVNPVNTYKEIKKLHKIDMVLYANNYEKNKVGIRRLKEKEQVLDLFINAKRMAIGTTNEIGISTTFFANPFGCVQKENECRKLLDYQFGLLLENNIYIGEIYTLLAIDKTNATLKKSSIELLKLLCK